MDMTKMLIEIYPQRIGNYFGGVSVVCYKFYKLDGVFCSKSKESLYDLLELKTFYYAVLFNQSKNLFF